MLRAAIWRDLRWRLLAATFLAAPLALLVAWSYAGRARAGEVVQRNYVAYLDAAWFHLPGPSSAFLLLAVILGAGGGLIRPRAQVAYLLTLPTSRRRMLVSYLVAVLAALAACVLVIDLILAAGAWSANVPLPLAPMIVRSVLVFLAAAVWACVTIGVLTVVRHAVLALASVLGAVMLLPANRFRLEVPPTGSRARLAAWDAWAFADPRAWQGGIPVESLLVAIVLAAGGVMLALRRLERFEP
jgi:hypothetical protein